jgi:hypothetical protein
METISLEQIIKGDDDLYIVSGEGEGEGTEEEFEGPRTVAALKKRLKEERCQGDRWAFVTDGQYRAEK